MDECCQANVSDTNYCFHWTSSKLGKQVSAFTLTHSHSHTQLWDTIRIMCPFFRRSTLVVCQHARSSWPPPTSTTKVVTHKASAAANTNGNHRWHVRAMRSAWPYRTRACIRQLASLPPLPTTRAAAAALDSCASSTEWWHTGDPFCTSAPYASSFCQASAYSASSSSSSSSFSFTFVELSYFVLLQFKLKTTRPSMRSCRAFSTLNSSFCSSKFAIQS